jgi:hypothetical protein
VLKKKEKFFRLKIKNSKTTVNPFELLLLQAIKIKSQLNL